MGASSAIDYGCLPGAALSQYDNTSFSLLASPIQSFRNGLSASRMPRRDTRQNLPIYAWQGCSHSGAGLFQVGHPPIPTF